MKELIKLDRNIAPFAGTAIEVPCRWTKEFYEEIFHQNKFCSLNGVKCVLVYGRPKALSTYPMVESLRFMPQFSDEALCGNQGDIIYLTYESTLVTANIQIGKIF